MPMLQTLWNSLPPNDFSQKLSKLPESEFHVLLNQLDEEISWLREHPEVLASLPTSHPHPPCLPTLFNQLKKHELDIETHLVQPEIANQWLRILTQNPLPPRAWELAKQLWEHPTGASLSLLLKATHPHFDRPLSTFTNPITANNSSHLRTLWSHIPLENREKTFAQTPTATKVAWVTWDPTVAPDRPKLNCFRNILTGNPEDLFHCFQHFYKQPTQGASDFNTWIALLPKPEKTCMQQWIQDNRRAILDKIWQSTPNGAPFFVQKITNQKRPNADHGLYYRLNDTVVLEALPGMLASPTQRQQIFWIQTAAENVIRPTLPAIVTPPTERIRNDAGPTLEPVTNNALNYPPSQPAASLAVWISQMTLSHKNNTNWPDNLRQMAKINQNHPLPNVNTAIAKSIAFAFAQLDLTLTIKETPAIHNNLKSWQKVNDQLPPDLQTHIPTTILTKLL